MSLLPFSEGHFTLTVVLFMIVLAGCKAWMPAFWSLPSLFLVNTAAAGSIGLINSIGNLGGFFGPSLTGAVRSATGSFHNALYCFAGSMLAAAAIVFVIATKCRRDPGN